MMTESELSSPTSTSSSGDLSPKKMDDKTNYRKSNKPMMEKKRRARINSCLSQLKSLVLQAMKKDNSQYSKLEKADILELTVKHLRNVQRYQATSLAQVPDAMSKYRAGFNECASEVMRYLEESQGVNDEARTRILSHLASILSPINALPLQQTHTPILPAPSPMHQQQQQQQQHHHLQQLQLQQQHAGVFLNPSTQQISIDTNNNKPSASHAAFLTSQANTVDIKNVISGSPTAFQSPIASGVNVPVSLQLPSIATAAMATTQLQLVPSTLPSGQVALVLAPQPVSAMGVYTSTQPPRQQLGHDTLKLSHDSLSTQHHLIAAQEDIKPRTVTRCNELPMALVTKATRSHRMDNSSTSAPYQRPITPYQIKRSSSPLPSSSSSSSSTSSSLSQYSLHSNRQSNVVVSSSVPKTTGTTVIVNNSSSNNSGVVKATSTWRPW